MLKNYIKIALRNIRKHKAYSFINLLGLAIGIACCILILLYIQDELSFDRFHQKADQIYRVIETREESADQGMRQFGLVAGPLGPTMVQEIPGVENFARIHHSGRLTVIYQEKRFYEQLLVSDNSLFELFDFEFLQGDPKTALKEPATVVVTQETAEKYFGDDNPMGKFLKTDRGVDVKVSGVLANLPYNSHLQFNILFSMATIEASENWRRATLERWDRIGFGTYVLLDGHYKPSEVESKLPALLEKYHPETYDVQKVLSLQPLTDVHFGSGNIEFGHNANKGDIAYVFIFGAIAFFIVLIACINYMNLATARSVSRATEVGLRKVVGAHRHQLMGQFFCESVIMSFAALLLAYVAVQNVLPFFNSFTGKDLVFNFFGNGLVLLGFVFMAFVVGLISGSYPALYLSNLRIIKILKGEIKANSGQAFLRRGLVITQFTLSTILIVVTFVAFDQLNYIQQKHLGFNEEHLIVVDINSGVVRRSFQEIKNDFSQGPDVKSVSVSSRVPGEWKWIVELDVVGEGSPETDAKTMHFFGVDQDFLSTFEVELAAGRNFDPTMTTDTTAVLINEAAAQVFGWDDPVGKTFRVPGDNFEAHIIGVVKDFHFRSLHEKIGPLLLGHSHNPIHSIDYFTVRTSSANIPATLEYLQAAYEKYDNITPMEYHFLDQQLENFYEADRRFGSLFGMAASLAIFIACLGLFGLAAFTAEQRTKEIGVRKVLGASVSQIVLLLSKEFTKLVAVALLIAAPIAYFATDKWLQEFAYHTNPGIGIFLLAGLLALLIALATVSYQAIRAALTNPIDSLRYE